MNNEIAAHVFRRITGAKGREVMVDQFLSTKTKQQRKGWTIAKERKALQHIQIQEIATFWIFKALGKKQTRRKLVLGPDPENRDLAMAKWSFHLPYGKATGSWLLDSIRVTYGDGTRDTTKIKEVLPPHVDDITRTICHTDSSSFTFGIGLNF